MVYRLFVLNRDEDVDDDTEDVKVATSSLQSAPDRDRSDDPVTGADTSAGDFFDDEGNPLTEEEYIALHRERIETDLMPEDADVVDELATDVVDVIETGEAYAEPGGSGTGNSDGTSSDDSDGGRS